jgi:uncharacterized protein YybS (DUF2232 family)
VRFRDLFGLTRAALASALMFMMGAIIPVVGALAMLFSPAPVLGCAVGFRHATWRSAAVAALAAGLVMFAGGWQAGSGYLATIGAAAIAISYLIERRQPFERIVVGATAIIVTAGAGFALAYAGSPQALAQELHHNLAEALEHGQKFYGAAGLDVVLTPDVRASVVDTTLSLMPALMVISTALIVLANLAVFWRISGRQQRIGYPLFGDLVRWSTPDWLIWVLLVTGFGLFIPMPAMSTIALNCFVVVAAIYFCQGLAIMAFYFRLLAMPSLARGLIYFITIVQPVLAVLVCAAGILDFWIDFRRLKPPSAETRNLGDFL